MRTEVIGLAGLLAIAAHVGRASACDCAPDSSYPQLIPRSGSILPLGGNPRILLRIPLGDDPANVVASSGPFSVTCVTREGALDEARLLPQVALGYKAALISLVRNGAWPSGAQCAVRDATLSRRLARESLGVVGWFRVAEHSDTSAPTLAKPQTGQVAPGRTLDAMCEDGTGAAWLPLSHVHDDASEADDLVFEVWVLRQGRSFSSSSPPTTWLLPGRTQAGLGLVLSGGHLCRRGGNFPFPGYGEQVDIAFRALDSAGRTSTLWRARLDGTASSWQSYALGLDQRRKIAPAQFTPLADKSSSPTPRRRSVRLLWLLVGVTFAVAGWLVASEFVAERAASKRDF